MLPHRVLGLGALVSTILLALCTPRHAAAQPAPSRVSVLTMGPGDHPFTRFGHNAILLEWEDSGDSAVFNFGTFEFDGLQGVQDFMAGRFRYWLSVTTLEPTLHAYGEAQRSLSAQELVLTHRERAELFAALRDNAQPDHRYYDYDYYRDNCSTRVRDALDKLLNGELRRGVHGDGRLSFRQHTLRLVGAEPWLYFGLDMALGAPTDRTISRWDELFLPQELHDALAHATRQLHGRTVPLVKAERQLLRAQRAPLPALPPSRTVPFAAIGLAIGAGLSGLGYGAARSRATRVLFGAVTAFSGLLLGLLGTALAVFWCSKHWAAHDNRSLLACPPWALALTVLGVGLARGRKQAWPALRLALGASSATSVCLLLLSLTPSARESLRTALLFVPLWSGWLYGVYLALGQPTKALVRARDDDDAVGRRSAAGVPRRR